MKLTVSHRITTRFSPARRRFVQSHRLFPTLCASQQTLVWDVAVSAGQIGAAFTDGAGDQTATVSTPGEIEALTLEVAGTVQPTDTQGVLRDLREKVPPLTYMTPTRLARPDEAIRALAADALAAEGTDAPLAQAHALAQAVSAALTEEPSSLDDMRPAAEVLEAGAGGDTDFAHVLIAAAQAAAIPARFVCGYIVQGPLSMQSEASGDTPGPAIAPWAGHAWAELWVDALGWVGFDTTRECCPDERYIRLCSGRDGADAAPLRGTALGSGAAALEVALDVRHADQ